MSKGQLAVTAELVRRPIEQLGLTIVDPEQCVKLIHDFTGGHPNVVQRLCARLIGRLQRQAQREVTVTDIDTIIKDPTFQREDFLSTYLQRTTELEQIIMLVLSQAEFPMTRDTIRKALAAYGIRPSIVDIETSLHMLSTMRQMLEYTQNGYRCIINGFPMILGRSILVKDKIEELTELYRQQHRRKKN